MKLSSYGTFYILNLSILEFLETIMVKKLNTLLGCKYEKNSDSIYDDLRDKQDTAIKNAENLIKQYQPHNPARDNPSTTVHLLVKELNRFII